MSKLLKNFSPDDRTAKKDHRTLSHEYQAKVATEHPEAEVRYNQEQDSYEVWSGPRPVDVQAVEEAVLASAKQAAGYDEEGRAIVMTDEEFDQLADKVADRIMGRLVTALGLEL